MQAPGVGEVSEEEVSRLNQDLLMLSLDTDPTVKLEVQLRHQIGRAHV